MRRNTKLVLAIAFAHLVASIVSIGVAFQETMRVFDDPVAEVSSAGHLASGIGSVLILPAGWLWTSWASKTLPNAVEWLLVMFNSLLWGYVIERALRYVRAGFAAREAEGRAP